MGVTRATPWWLTWLLLGGLCALFVGERIVETVGPARVVFSGIGVLIVTTCLVWRALAWRSAKGEARGVEGLLLLAYAGCLLALIGYLLSSEFGMRWLGIEFAEYATRVRYRTILQVLWPMLLAVSLLPALGAQVALGAHRYAGGAATGVESYRVMETAVAGLTVALAGALLFMVGYIASARDKSLDLSYFKTAVPGEATEGMVSTLDEPLRVLLFFPAVNEVKDQVERYFRRLADVTGQVRIEYHDRLASPRVAEEFFVTEDGMVVLVRGDQSERLAIGTEMSRARAGLRSLDREVQNALLPILRERRTVYLTTGHGELNDPQSAGPAAGSPFGGVDALKQILQYLNYEVRDLGLGGGLAADVPPDATIVMALGPRRPFLEGELNALDRFLARGGALLLAVDPEADFRMGHLERRLGVRYVPVPLADDQQHVVQRGDISDRRLIVTDRFYSHEVLTTVNRGGVGAGILLARPGYLEHAEDAEVEAQILVRSLPSTFADLDGDFTFTESTETRGNFGLLAATEGPPIGAASGEGENAGAERRMRALVFPSSAMFSDPVLTSLGLNAGLVADGVKWLGGEEAFVGPTQSEEDVPIVHTRTQDIAWFYATILGAPGLLLALGLIGVYRHRRRRGDG